MIFFIVVLWFFYNKSHNHQSNLEIIIINNKIINTEIKHIFEDPNLYIESPFFTSIAFDATVNYQPFVLHYSFFQTPLRLISCRILYRSLHMFSNYQNRIKYINRKQSTSFPVELNYSIQFHLHGKNSFAEASN